MKTVWKYSLEATDKQFITMPRGAQVLSVAEQYDDMSLWALVDTNEVPDDAVLIVIHGTGHPADDVEGLRFIGTVILRGGSLVFHVWAS